MSWPAGKGKERKRSRTAYTTDSDGVIYIASSDEEGEGGEEEEEEGRKKQGGKEAPAPRPQPMEVVVVEEEEVDEEVAMVDSKDQGPAVFGEAWGILEKVSGVSMEGAPLCLSVHHPWSQLEERLRGRAAVGRLTARDI